MIMFWPAATAAIFSSAGEGLWDPASLTAAGFKEPHQVKYKNDFNEKPAAFFWISEWKE